MQQIATIPDNRLRHLDWTRVKLRDIATYINGRAFKPSEWSKKGLPIIRIQNLNRDKSEFNYCDFKVDQKYFVDNGDLLFAWSGTPDTSFGAHIWKGTKAVLNQHIFRIEIDPTKVTKAFLLYALNNKVKEYVAKAHGTAGLAHITKRKFEESEILLPPIREQNRIVSKIEELFSELDKGVEQLKTAQQQLKVYRQAVLKYAFEGKLTNEKIINRELPEGWRVEDLGNFIKSIEAGKSFKCEERSPKPEEIGVVKVSAVTWGVFDQEESKTILTNDRFNPNYLIQKDDFLFSRANTIELVGACTIVRKIDKRLMLSDKILRFKFSTSLNKEYALYYLRSRAGRREIETLSTGNQESMRNIGQERIKQILIPFCEIEEQKKIVQEIESRLSVCEKLEETISNSLNRADALRQSILKKAFEGKLLYETEGKNIRSLVYSNSEEQIMKIAAEPKTRYKKKLKQAQVQFPKVIDGIKATDLHAGILAMVIEAHEKSAKHHMKLSHVKGEKIAHLVEAHIGIDLGRVPKKDAAGPDDFPHLKKVESRATKAGWFGVKKLRVGQTYVSKSGMPKIIKKVKETLPGEYLNKIEQLIQTFLPFELEHAEVIATLYAGWNNLLLEGKNPTDEEIVYESRENWSERKLGIERQSFFKALKWMTEHGYIPTGTGKKVV